MKVESLHHVSLAVDDVDAAHHFYADILGLTVRTDRPTDRPGAWLDTGSQRLNISPPEADGSGAHFALVVEDVGAAVLELEEAGVHVRELTAPMMNVMLQDPSGNWIELREPPHVWAERFG